jgi:beta-ureidopropionase / N-carbamoyl-L-amino-acid hydrolase
VGAMPARNLLVKGERLWASRMALAEIGAPRRGSVTARGERSRGQARCTIRVDKIGNIFGRQPGRDTSLPPAMTGGTSTRSRPPTKR